MFCSCPTASESFFGKRRFSPYPKGNWLRIYRYGDGDIPREDTPPERLGHPGFVLGAT
jgi:hypothetical protein